MVGRIARLLSAGAVLAVLSANVPMAIGDGWSIINPFSSSTSMNKSSNTKKAQITKVSKKDQSFLGKVNDGTKSFFDKTGETLGLKKTKTTKPQYAVPKNHADRAPKKAESKSWWQSLAPYDEEPPKKPKNVTDWMAQPRQDM